MSEVKTIETTDYKIGDRVRGRFSARSGSVVDTTKYAVFIHWDGEAKPSVAPMDKLHHVLKVVGNQSVVQDWVSTLPGLRHQGVLLTAIRGCDVSPKEDPSKALTRCFRAVVLNAHVGDPKKALTFIEDPGYEEVARRMIAVAKDHDALPHHYIMHLVHAAEIVGYHHPDAQVRELWIGFYAEMVRKLHLRCETKEELRERLCADEESFGANQ